MDFQVISFHCILKNKLGQVISSTINHEVLTFDPAGNQSLLKGLADGLKDLKTGEKRKIVLSAEEAYGYYDTEKVLTRPREEFPDEETLRVGELVKLPNSSGQKTVYRITELTPDLVYLDANHPLAGQDLVFEIEALKVRKATPEEIDESVFSPKGLLH